MNHSLIFTAGFAWVALCGCSDPSDKVAKAEAKAPAAASAEVTTTTAQSQEFKILPDSKIEFVGSKVTGSHSGGFKTFEGKLLVNPPKSVKGATIKIDTTSVWSDNEKLTGHLKSPDFFDVTKFPNSTFTVTSIEGEGAASKVTGNLELHGVTKSITFPANITVTDSSAHVTAEFAINRKDFQIVYPGKPDDLIRDNVVIKFDLKASKG